MKLFDKDSFYVKNIKGDTVKYDVLLSFTDDDSDKSYILYTDNSTDKYGNVQVYASTVNSDENEMTLSHIETDKEWKIIEIILSEIQNSLK